MRRIVANYMDFCTLRNVDKIIHFEMSTPPYITNMKLGESIDWIREISVDLLNFTITSPR